MCQIGTQTAKTAQQVWRHGHADDPPHLPGTLVASRALYRYVRRRQAAGQRTATHYNAPPPGTHPQGTVQPAYARCDDAQCTCTTPGGPSRSVSDQPGRIVPPDLVSFQPRPIRRRNPTAARSPRLLPEKTLRGPCRADQEPGIVPIPFLGGRRSNPPLHFIIPSIVRHCSVIQTASSGSPATRDTSPGALIRPSTPAASTRYSSSGLWTLLVRFFQQTLGG
ncbi:hypothetical protein GGI35DRAFT_352456 [Trichoderma velutinum]